MALSLRRVSSTTWIFVGMAVGVLLGVFFPGNGPKTPGFDAADLKILSDLFIRGIKMIIAPILVSTLIIGIAGHGDDLKKVGRLAFRSILYFEIVTTIALAVGLTAVNLVRPGDDARLRSALAVAEANHSGPQLAEPKPILDHIREIVPTSFVDALAQTTSSRSSSSPSSSPSRSRR